MLEGDHDSSKINPSRRISPAVMPLGSAGSTSVRYKSTERIVAFGTMSKMFGVTSIASWLIKR
uniref:Uncharacterized protein n=1 Tax=Anopheles atroparvus TaxID=41427 RepID=A0AAG5DE02_ANOAO